MATANGDSGGRQARREVTDRLPFKLPPWLRSHIPLVATGTVFAYLAARITRVSRLNAETARALIASADPSTVVLAAIVPAVVAASFSLLFTMTAISIDYAFIERRFTTYHAAYLIVLAGALVLVPIAWLLVPIVTSFVYIVAAVRVTRKRRAKDPSWRPRLNREGEVGLGLAFFLIIVLSADMWLPSERIHFKDGRTDVVGYWIGEDADWATLMTERERRIVVVLLASVQSREVCQAGRDDIMSGVSLPELIAGSSQADYPPCFPKEPADTSSTPAPAPPSALEG